MNCRRFGQESADRASAYGLDLAHLFPISAMVVSDGTIARRHGFCAAHALLISIRVVELQLYDHPPPLRSRHLSLTRERSRNARILSILVAHLPGSLGLPWSGVCGRCLQGICPTIWMAPCCLARPQRRQQPLLHRSHIDRRNEVCKWECPVWFIRSSFMDRIPRIHSRPRIHARPARPRLYRGPNCLIPQPF